MTDGYIRSKCMAIAKSHFFNSPYKGESIIDLYKVEGFANKASGICHYCTVDTLNAILEDKSLRFTDVRFLNDSTEFVEIIPLIKEVLNEEHYTSNFREFLLNSNVICELEEYKQSFHEGSIILNKHPIIHIRVHFLQTVIRLACGIITVLQLLVLMWFLILLGICLKNAKKQKSILGKKQVMIL